MVHPSRGLCHAPQCSKSENVWACSQHRVQRPRLEGWHEPFILWSSSVPPFFHLIYLLHLICLFPFRISHLAGLICPIRMIPAGTSFSSCLHLPTRPFSSASSGHIFIFKQAPGPSHLPRCHLEGNKQSGGPHLPQQVPVLNHDNPGQHCLVTKLVPVLP